MEVNSLLRCDVIDVGLIGLLGIKTEGRISCCSLVF